MAPTADPRPHRSALREAELLALLQTSLLDATAAEARRLLAGWWGRADLQGERVKPVRRVATEAFAALTRADTLTVEERVTDPSDGFVKYLLRCPDGGLIEAVRIPLHAPGHFTVCLSSQVGCAMGCVFCATGRLGLRRHLQAWEMTESLRIVRNEAPGRVTGAVFMGQGEPLHNYDAVLQAAHVLRQPYAARIAADAISISTVGLVPQILRYAAEKQPFRLVVSLTSAVPERRAALLPITHKYSLPQLAGALRTLHEACGQRLTVAWVLLGGINSGEDEVDALQNLLRDLPIRINLIDVNDTREAGFARATDAERARFVDLLQRLGQPVVRRYSGGKARHAACGMLAAQRLSEEA